MENKRMILDDLKKGYEHLERALEGIKKEEKEIDEYELEQLNYFLNKVAEPYYFIERRLELLKEDNRGL